MKHGRPPGRRSPRRTIALLTAALVAACGGDETTTGPPPGPPPPPPPPPPVNREVLIQQVRTLAGQRNLDPISAPAPVRPELVELGRALAFDKILSGNRDISCMTCHPPAFATTDGRTLSIGQGATGVGPGRVHPDGIFIRRHAPPLFNLHLQKSFFWDGRVEELEDGSIASPAGAQLTPQMQAVFEFGALSAVPMFPIASRPEMRGDDGNELAQRGDGDYTGMWSDLMARIGAIGEYRTMFEDAYPGTSFSQMTFAHAGNAIAGFFVSELSFADTGWDLFLRGDDDQLSNDQLEGALSFMNRRCMRCHLPDAFVDDLFHNVATPQLGPGSGDGPAGNDDFGREGVTADPADRRTFKTPQLRNVELTAPYGHAGQFAELLTIVEHYDGIDDRLHEYDPTQVEAPLQATVLDNFDDILANRDTILIPIELDDGEAEKLTEFLRSMTDAAARDLTAIIPATVPSGLEVDG
ncbi:MAG: cytochrome c peroxidase [Gemmatimonadota bacterium]|nr:cytochrome c peroxidase [Gemmatimonadota bacterium]